MKKNELLGIDYLKFLGILAMILAHCFIFLYRLFPELSEIHQLQLIHRFAYFNGFYSMTLPALAGVMLYEQIKNHIRHFKIANLHLQKLYQPLGFLFFIESIKNALIFGWVSFFRWDVLHMVSISMIILIYVLSRFSIKQVALINLCLVLLTPVVSFLLNQASASNIDINFDSGYFYYFGLIVWLLISYIIFQFIIQLHWIKTIFLLLGMFILLLSHHSSPELNTVISNYPLSIFMQVGQNGGHIWPLFPWISLIFTGLIFAYYIDKNKTHLFKLLLLQYVIQVPMAFMVLFKIELYTQHVSSVYFFNSSLFQPNIFILLILICFFISAYTVYNYLSSQFKIKSYFIKKVNELILPIYFIHLLVAWNIITPLVKLFPLSTLKWLYPMIVLFLTYCFTQVFLLASDKMIWFRLKKTIKD